MKVIVPVAGIGKRLKPHTDYLPKPLLTVAGTAILDHVLKPLEKIDVDELILVIGYKGELIQRHVEENYSFKARFVQQKKLFGLGYALRLALDETTDGPTLIILGDTIVECDLEKFTSAGDYVLALREVPDPERFGIAEIEDNYVKALQEKPKDPKTNLALIGLYYFADSQKLREILGAHVDSGKKTRGEIQFTDALHKMIEDGIKFVPHKVSGWHDCGTVRTMLEANNTFISRMNPATPPEGCRFFEPVLVADDAEVSNSILGPNVTIESKAVVKNCILKNCIVNREAVLENVVSEDSIFGRRAKVIVNRTQFNVGQDETISIDNNHHNKSQTF